MKIFKSPVPRRRAALAVAALAVLGVTTSMASETPARQKKDEQPSNAQGLPAVRDRTLETRDMRSAAGLQYRIFISTPVGPAPEAGYPIIYVLDANAWFGTMVEIVRLNEPGSGPAVVVGIGYPTRALFDQQRRVFDYTKPIPPSEMGDRAGLKTGGAPAFIHFMLDELRPTIKREIRIDRARQAIFGHSLSGRFVVELLFTQPTAFQTYIAVSPSLHLHTSELLEEERRFLARADKPRDVRLLLTAGMLEQFPDAEYQSKLVRMFKAHPELTGGQSSDAVLAEWIAAATKERMVDNARELAGRLAENGVAAKFISFAGEDHLSVAPVSINRAVGFALEANP